MVLVFIYMFFLWRKEEILSILFFHQCLYIHLILKTGIPFSWHASDATMVCTSKLCWCIEWYDMHFRFYVEDTKLHTCNQKYYKKIIVSRSLIHCIYIHVYVYLYDIMLRIFANSMCTWLLYETFFIPFMIEVTDAFFKNHLMIIDIFMVAWNLCTRYMCHINFWKESLQ